MNTQRATLLALVLASAACASEAPPGDARDTLLRALAGRWHNQAQYEAAPSAWKVPPSVAGTWLDVQHATFARVQAPAIGTHVLYLEWRNGGADGKVSRQRLWSFRLDPQTSELRMDFHAFVDGTSWQGKAAQASAFEGVDATQLRSYASACALRFNPQPGGGWRGHVGAAECTITAASGRRMGITATVELAADGTLSYREAGLLEGGGFAFRVPPEVPYRFVKVAPASP